MNNLKGNIKKEDRLIFLLKQCVNHIVSFEEDEAENVFKSLGFTDKEREEYVDI